MISCLPHPGQVIWGMENEDQARQCLCCGKALKGRSDKKFCHDNCRNQFNNKIREEESSQLRTINRILRRNRKILKELLPNGSERTEISKEQLVFLQFHFCFFTHTHTNKKGRTFLFCYEFGYLTLSHDRILVVKRSPHLIDQPLPIPMKPALPFPCGTQFAVR